MINTTKVSKTSPKNNFETKEEMLREQYIYIYIYIYISLELRQKIIDNLRLKKD